MTDRILEEPKAFVVETNAPHSEQKHMQTFATDLKIVFNMYCEYSEDSDTAFLRDSSFRKLLVDTGIFTPSNKEKNTIYLIYLSLSQGKKLMNFEMFKSSLLKIAEVRFHEIYNANPKDAFMKVMDILLKFTSQLTSNDVTASPPNYTTIDINSSVAILVSNIQAPLSSIYQSYFFVPLKKVRKDEDLCSLLPKLTYTFLRDFSICPDLVSKQRALSALEVVRAIPDQQLMGSAASLFSQNGEKKKFENYGEYFSFKRYLHYLIYVSTVGFSCKKITPQIYSVAEQFFYILTKMELSNGFQKLQKIGTKYMFNSLIPSQSVIAQVVINNPMDITDQKESTVKKDKFIEKEMMSSNLFADKLRRVFLWYCSIGTSAESNLLTIVKYIKLLRDAGLIKEVKSEHTLLKNEAEIIYSKVISAKNNKATCTGDEEIHLITKSTKQGGTMVCKPSKQAHLDYDDFVYALSLCAQKIYPNIDPDKALILVSENSLLKINELNEEIDKDTFMLQEMLKVLQEAEVIKLLELLHKLLKGYYDEYMDATGFMTYFQFINMYRDFNLFPDLISKSVLHRIFHSLSSATVQVNAFQPNGEATTQLPKDKIVIDYNLFIRSIALCAFQCKLLSKQASPLKKILHIAEKMMQSVGISKIRLKKGKTRSEADTDIDPLIIIRKQYGKYLQQSQKEMPNVDQMLIYEEAKE